MDIKQKLYKVCHEFVQNKLQTIEQTIQSNKNALNSETKSSAGDKHETGRAMLQLEMEKAGQQLKVVSEMRQQLDRIDLEVSSNLIRLGSVVMTSQMNYFIAISTGQIIVEGNPFFAVSSNSPIGMLLIGKSEGESVLFRNQKIKINKVL